MLWLEATSPSWWRDLALDVQSCFVVAKLVILLRGAEALLEVKKDFQICKSTFANLSKLKVITSRIGMYQSFMTAISDTNHWSVTSL